MWHVKQVRQDSVFPILTWANLWPQESLRPGMVFGVVWFLRLPPKEIDMPIHALPVTYLVRTEFGFSRTVCACREYTVNCHFIPGYLIPVSWNVFGNTCRRTRT